jgi:hypothetical protein
VLFLDLRERAHVEFETAVGCGIKNVNKSYLSREHSSGSVDKGGHGKTRRREIDGEEDVFDHRQGGLAASDGIASLANEGSSEDNCSGLASIGLGPLGPSWVAKRISMGLFLAKVTSLPRATAWE